MKKAVSLSAIPTDTLNELVNEVEDLRMYGECLLELAFRSHPIKEKPRLEWRTNLRVTAGRAYLTENLITLSVELMINRDRVWSTLLHEYAHHLCVHRYGLHAGRGHGYKWKRCMIDLGQEPKRCHDYDVRRNKRRHFVVYICNRCQREIIKNRRLKADRHYTHVRCGGDVIFLRRVKRG